MDRVKYMVDSIDVDFDPKEIIYDINDIQQLLTYRNFMITTAYRFFRLGYDVISRFMYIVLAIITIVSIIFAFSGDIEWATIINTALADCILITISYVLRLKIFKAFGFIRMRTVELLLPHIDGFDKMPKWEQEKIRDNLMILMGLRKVT